jgi:ribosomal protein S18 acetylase RimI-like enzyme
LWQKPARILTHSRLADYDIMEFRNLAISELSLVMRLQQQVYMPELVESAQSFERKLTLFSEGSLGCFEPTGMAAYGFGHPWTAGSVVPLGHVIDHLPLDPDCFYIHDVAVSPDCRRRGIARKFVEIFINLARARDLEMLACLAVQDSDKSWEKLGFKPRYRIEYAPGIHGTYMVLPLSDRHRV